MLQAQTIAEPGSACFFKVAGGFTQFISSLALAMLGKCMSRHVLWAVASEREKYNGTYTRLQYDGSMMQACFVIES